MEEWVGFYWTLPITWAGFIDPGRDVARAAERSKTIRYQRTMVQSWITNNKSNRLVHEHVFIKSDTCLCSSEICLELDRLARFWDRGVGIIFVDFSKKFNNRDHYFLREYEAHRKRVGRPFRMMDLYPATIAMAGFPGNFDPITHFRRSRLIDRDHRRDVKTEAIAGLLASLEAVPPGYGRWQKIAARLNEMGVPTIRGQNVATDDGGTLSWTGDRARKLYDLIEKARAVDIFLDRRVDDTRGD